MTALGADVPRAAANAKAVALIATWAVACGVFLSGFVLREPAPYEIYMVALIATWSLFGLRLSRGLMPLLILLLVYNLGGLIAMTQMTKFYETPLYLAVTLFLSLTSVFYAAIIRTNPDLLRPIFNAFTAAAVVTSVLGVAGYFDLFPGAEIFTRYGRATGVFEDPNVYGPFIILPATYLVYRMLTGRIVDLPLLALPLLPLLAGLFLSFSRGAWGLFAFCVTAVAAVLFLQAKSGRFRLRIIVISAIALMVLTVAVLVAVQLPQVHDLFESRAKLVQVYDSWRLGRFARYWIGLFLTMEHPLGIGALNFGREFGEDTHNIWLKALLDYSWLGFAAYFTLIAWTLVAGFRVLFRDRPWQPFMMCAYITFLGHVVLGSIIDMDHWRHFYLLLGLVWGCIALEQRHLALSHATSPKGTPAASVSG